MWPVWDAFLGLDTIRTLLASADLDPTSGDQGRACLRARGVCAVYAARRLKVGSRQNVTLNVTLGAPLWTA